MIATKFNIMNKIKKQTLELQGGLMNELKTGSEEWFEGRDAWIFCNSKKPKDS